MIEFHYIIKDPQGIHARPAGLIVASMKPFASETVVIHDGRMCDLKKIMPLLGMGIACHDEITLRVEGSDEAECAAVLKQELKQNL